MRDNGTVFASFSITANSRFAGDLQLACPGLLDEQEDADLMEEYKAEISYSLENAKKNAGTKELENMVFQQVKRLIKKDLDKKPLVIVKAVAAN